MKLIDNKTEDRILSQITAGEILTKSGLSEMDKEIFLLRHLEGMSLIDIGTLVGNKYREEPYVEGAIRYRLRLIRTQIDSFLNKP